MAAKAKNKLRADTATLRGLPWREAYQSSPSGVKLRVFQGIKSDGRSNRAQRILDVRMQKRLASALVPLLFSLAACSRASESAPSAAPAECAVNQGVENPLHDPERIAAMQVLVKKGKRGNALADKREGVVLALKPERGLTREWLSHVLACDNGADHPPADTCPLSLPGARVSVDSVDGRLLVYVRYSDPRVVERAAQLAERFGPS
jgi:hypothetical protein